MIYLFSTRITINGTAKLQDESSFKQLKSQFNDTLECPCSNLSIPYQTFVSLKAIFHPICSSDLQPIIEILFNYTETLSNNKDFRFTAALQFHLLTVLCSSVNEIITAYLIDFNKTSFTNILLLEESNFRHQVKEIIVEFIQMITSHFLNSLKMIRINNFGSQVRLEFTFFYFICVYSMILKLISGIRSNYKIMGYIPKRIRRKLSNLDDRYSWHFLAYSQIYDGPCDCSTSFFCSSSAFIYENNQTFMVNGFRIGCFILESLLVSSLECFYNTSCLNQFLRLIRFNSSLILLSSNKFNKADSIEMILNILMVEQWQNSTNYTAYFVACQVKHCSYSFEGHRSLISIATAMLDLIGGLPKILLFIIPIVVAFIQRKRYFPTASSKCLFTKNLICWLHM